MKVFKRTALATVLAGIGSACMAYGEPPSGWTLTSASAANVKIYKKNGAEIYAQVVDMAGGAKVELKQVKVGTMTNQWGTFNTYKRDSIANWYTGSGSPVSVVNGDFFNQGITPTTLSFAVRSSGVLVEPGGEPTSNKRQIEFFTGQGAMVIAASAWRIANGTTAQNAMGGHAPADTPTPGYARGRTSLCTLSPSSPSRLFLILSHTSATKAQVDADFVSWKCNSGSEIIMDGSASAQLRTTISTVKVDGIADGGATGRTVPQVIVIRNN